MGRNKLHKHSNKRLKRQHLRSKAPSQCKSWVVLIFGLTVTWIWVAWTFVKDFFAPCWYTADVVDINVFDSTNAAKRFNLISPESETKKTMSKNNINDKNSNTTFNIAIATVAFYTDPDMTSYNNHKLYAKYHEYDYYCLRHPWKNSKHLEKRTFWKPLLIDGLLHYKHIYWDDREKDNIKTWRKANKRMKQHSNGNNIRYDYVFWIDFDAFFMNFDISIESVIIRTYNLYYNLQIIKKHNKNAKSQTQTSNTNHNGHYGDDLRHDKVRLHSRNNEQRKQSKQSKQGKQAQVKRYISTNNDTIMFNLIATCDIQFCMNAGVTIWRVSQMSHNILTRWLDFINKDSSSSEQMGIIAVLKNINFEKIIYHESISGSDWYHHKSFANCSGTETHHRHKSLVNYVDNVNNDHGYGWGFGSSIKKCVDTRLINLDKKYINNVALIPIYWMNSFAQIFKSGDFILHMAGPLVNKFVFEKFFIKSGAIYNMNQIYKNITDYTVAVNNINHMHEKNLLNKQKNKIQTLIDYSASNLRQSNTNYRKHYLDRIEMEHKNIMMEKKFVEVEF